MVAQVLDWLIKWGILLAVSLLALLVAGVLGAAGLGQTVLVWLGVLGNLVFSVLALFAPRYLLNMLHMPQVSQTVWLRDSGGLLLLLSWSQ